MGWVVFIYSIASVAVAISAMVRVSLWTGVSIILASFLALIGTGGIKAALLWYEKNLRFPRLAIGVVMVGGALWLSRYFSVGMFGYPITGLEWTGLGVLVGVVCVGKSLAM